MLNMQDLLFYVLYITPFIILALYRDRTGLYVFRVNCANTLMLFYMIADHLGLLLLYLHPNGIKQLSSINQETVILLAFYSIVVVMTYVVTGRISGSKHASVRIPDRNILRSEKVNRLAIVLVLLVAAPIAVVKLMSGSPLLILLSGDALGANMARVEEVSLGKW